MNFHWVQGLWSITCLMKDTWNQFRVQKMAHSFFISTFQHQKMLGFVSRGPEPEKAPRLVRKLGKPMGELGIFTSPSGHVGSSGGEVWPGSSAVPHFLHIFST